MPVTGRKKSAPTNHLTNLQISIAILVVKPIAPSLSWTFLDRLPMLAPVSQDTCIQLMLAEIEASMLKTGVDFDSPIHRAYIAARMEMGSTDPDLDNVYIILANVLSSTLATRH